jgi:hypothetical protein
MACVSVPHVRTPDTVPARRLTLELTANPDVLSVVVPSVAASPEEVPDEGLHERSRALTTAAVVLAGCGAVDRAGGTADRPAST